MSCIYMYFLGLWSCSNKKFNVNYHNTIIMHGLLYVTNVRGYQIRCEIIQGCMLSVTPKIHDSHAESAMDLLDGLTKTTTFPPGCDGGELPYTTGNCL